MKKVRFETPNKSIFSRMDDSECHSPRPFLERQAMTQAPDIYEYKRVIYSSDPVHRFEYSDSSPYPLIKKTTLPSVCDSGPNWLPSNDLNLSMLDCHEPRPLCHPSLNPFTPERMSEAKENTRLQPKVLSSIENDVVPPNVLNRDDSFFIRKNDLDKYNFDVNPLHKQFNRIGLDKENYPVAKKAEIVKAVTQKETNNLYEKCYPQPVVSNTASNYCSCHHCLRVQNIPSYGSQNQPCLSRTTQSGSLMPACRCQQITTCFHCETHIHNAQKPHNYSQTPLLPQNAVDKKTWAIQKFEQSKKSDCIDIEKQTVNSKEKREPTISDLLKIIKLQNEQLQLLQEKVDKFITTNTNHPKLLGPVQNYMTEHVALQTIDSEHKISIGVMTSFEVVRTSTVINKEILQTTDNAQIQCNRSEISIKEVVTKQPVNLNFLDGIAPVARSGSPKMDTQLNKPEEVVLRKAEQQTTNVNEEKTLNEMSLYNVQLDNATTPMMSPEQTMYLDVRDYSDSDSTSSDQSNVGWTYYNKVMTHVNGMLQDSDMPSSASALYRNTRQQCVQMQIDKTNVSVTKRVKFGDDPYGIHQPHIYAASTDTSLKMNQLAAKYLNKGHIPLNRQVVKPTTTPIEMSFATRNYMERHKLLHGLPTTTKSPQADMPRFLDITALKQQTKLL